MTEFSSLIHDRRRLLGLTQQDLGRLIGGKTDSYIALLEGGKRGIDIGDLPMLAGALKLDASTLIQTYMRERYPGVYAVLFRDLVPEIGPEQPGMFISDTASRLQSLPRELRSPIEAVIHATYDIVHRPAR